MIDFEFIANNTILLFDNGKCIAEETLDYTAYDVYRGTVDNTVDLIPSCYYKLLKNNKTLTDIAFDEKWWNDKVLSKIGNSVNDSLYKFQRETIFRMIKTKRCLNACSPGLGKTIQALSCLVYFNGDSTNDLILCPSYLRANWMEEIKKWYPSIVDISTVIWKAGKKEIENVIELLFNQPGIKIVSYDMFASICAKTKKNTNFDTIIMDESHMMKNGLSVRYKNTSSYIKSCKQLFLLSGTPSPNRSNELYTQFSMINPAVFYDYKLFAFRYCNGHYDKFNRFDDRGSSKTQELSFMMSKLSLRLRREDHLDDLPAVIRQKIVVTPKKPTKTFFKKKMKFMEMLGHVDDSEEAKFKLQALASEMFRDTAAIKIDPVIEYLENYTLDPELEKTILFCKHQMMLQAVSEYLTSAGHKFIAISGQTPMCDRMGLIDKFKTDPSCTFAVLTIGSCNTGLTITPIRKMVFLELTWTPTDLDQAEARINRFGGSKNLHYIYLVCENSLDDMVFNKLKKKTALITEVVDGAKRYRDFEFEGEQQTTKNPKLHC